MDRAEQATELHRMLGGSLSEDQCDAVFAPDATHAFVSEILRALREGRATVVSEDDQNVYEQMSEETRAVLLTLPDPPSVGIGHPDLTETSAEALKRQVAELESALAATAEQLAHAKKRKERMALMEPASEREVAAQVSYDKKLRDMISAELEACTAAELECVDAISGLEAAFSDLQLRLDPAGPFLLPPARLNELCIANNTFLETAQSLVDASTTSTSAAGDDGSPSMRETAMLELRRLQDLFINTELDRTDALLIVEESLATESVAQAQLAELASGTGIRAQEQHDGLATVEEKVVAKRQNMTSLRKQAEKLRKETELALLLELKESQALPIKEGDYTLRLAEREAELQRLRKVVGAVEELKLRMQVLETFAAHELSDHRQRASAISACLAQLNLITQSAPLAARGAAHAASPPAICAASAERESADKNSLDTLQGLLVASAGARTQGASPSKPQKVDAAFAAAADASSASAENLLQVVESLLSSVCTRPATEHADALHALLALERRRAGQLQQYHETLWRHAGAEDKPIATPPPLAEAISSLQEVRQELEKKLQRIQHLRRSCEAPPQHSLAFVDFFMHPERMIPC